jgi:hypothetical protein
MNSFAGLWRGFSARAKKTDRQWPFDPMSYPVYAVIGMALPVEVFGIWARGFSNSPSAFLSGFYVLLWAAATAPVARAYGFSRLALLLDAIALPGIIGPITVVGVQLMCTFSGPLVDDALASADRALGLDWMALFHFYQRHPWIVEASNWAYLSMITQNFAIPLLLAVTAQRRRLWALLIAWCVAGIITTALFPFFPAASAIPYYGVRLADLPALDIDWPWHVESMIVGLRDGTITDLAQVQVGLVTFPSFHACESILFLWAIWETRWFRYPMALLNIAMLLSTPIRGSHYFIDVIGGVILAIIAISLAVRWTGREGHARSTEGEGTITEVPA